MSLFRSSRYVSPPAKRGEGTAGKAGGRGGRGRLLTVTADLQNRHEGFVEIDGKAFYVIPDVDQLAPFLMNVVSSSDLWMFVTSRGGLTAGRGDATKALFPYETEDRLFRSHGTSGPATVIRTGGVVWEPFAGRPRPETVRNLYKSVVGDEVIFEEINAELDLTFSSRWSTSEQFGFVRTSRLANLGNQPVAVDVVDGLLDILPAGLEPSVYYEMGNLVNAYKRSELIDPSSRLAAYTLESQVLDRAEPAESLRATTVWAVGSETATVTLDPDAVNSFALGSPVKPIELLTGRPGAYLVVDSMVVSPAEACDWSIVADVARSQAQVAETRAFLRDSAERSAEVRRSVDHGTASLAAMMAGADGSQLTGDRMTAAHHLANVLYNAMRGGVFADAYDIDTRDYRAFLEARNRRVAVRHAGALDRLEQRMARRELLEMAADSADPHLIRLTLEYLPLSFSRRHGDPSRPWNKFSIRLRDRTGAPLRYYEGNWRDIFQNWEALCLSYPDYLPGVIATFVNASTVDGFNAYRLTRDGIDWEVPEPDRPWGNIGYWGDHQIVYLLRLLEAAQRFEPGEMTALLGWEGFSYADVPYRIAPYERIKQDPERTIEFDEEAAALTALRVEEYGSDGRLLPGDNGDVYLVTLLEKLVVPALSKLSNFVPGGGIWMNTQRPEWNDAHNALVGNGLSMVTLYYLRRYLAYLQDTARSSDLDSVAVSAEVAEWLHEIVAVLSESLPDADSVPNGHHGWSVTDRLGEAFSRYRARVYGSGFSGKATLPMAAVLELCETGLAHLDDTIRRSRRSDGLFHSYNLLRPEQAAIGVDHLYEMLEGQVAAISSGLLTATEIADVVEALFDSALWRSDQQSFMLYPKRRLPSFLHKNIVPAPDVQANPLLAALAESGEESVIVTDVDGNHRFSSDFANRRDLEEALAALGPAWQPLVDRHREEALTVYEDVFRHRRFTGRSGSMYAYEGIGSIYWHMVAKLLVAIQEAFVDAATEGTSQEAERLAGCYRRVRAGLGFNKTAAEYGAFPADPYSHTPAHAGAQQPGMTGQVKEEIITRFGELGVRVAGGTVRFDPGLLDREEFLSEPAWWEVVAANGETGRIELLPGSLGFTVCGVPVVYRLAGEESELAASVVSHAGDSDTFPGAQLDSNTSRRLFARDGSIQRIDVAIPVSALTAAGG